MRLHPSGSSKVRVMATREPHRTQSDAGTIACVALTHCAAGTDLLQCQIHTCTIGLRAGAACMLSKQGVVPARASSLAARVCSTSCSWSWPMSLRTRRPPRVKHLHTI